MDNHVNESLSEEEKREIGARFLRAFKESRSIENKQEIARLMGYGVATVYKIVDGSQELNFSKLARFSSATGFSIHWLITGEGLQTIRRVDFKNLWARIVQAWEREIAISGDSGLRVELESAKGMAQRNFLPDFKVVERVSIITNTPLLWLLTGEGESRSEKPFENQPVYVADLITDYKAKETLPLPYKNKLMTTEAFNGEDRLAQAEPVEGIEHSRAGSDIVESARRFIREIVNEELQRSGSNLKFDSTGDEARLRASQTSERASKRGGKK